MAPRQLHRRGTLVAVTADEDRTAMKSRVESAVIGIVSLLLVVAAMAALDETVRGHVTALLHGDLSTVSAFADARLQDGTRAFHTFAFQANGYKPLSAFAVCASVLVLFLRKL
jgi:hypothetical protein